MFSFFKSKIAIMFYLKNAEIVASYKFKKIAFSALKTADILTIIVSSKLTASAKDVVRPFCRISAS